MSEVLALIKKPQPEEDDIERRAMAEATRLANLAPGEYQLWVDSSARRLGLPVARLSATVRGILAARKKEAKEEERMAKEKARAFAALKALSAEARAAGLATLATSLDENIDTLCKEFAKFAGPESHAVIPWEEPVDTKELLQDVAAQVRKYVVVKPHEALAVALWAMQTWVHDIAMHSPILVATSPVEDSGKTTLLNVLSLMTPRPEMEVETTAAVYQLTDTHCTLLIDEADSIFKRKNDLQHVINAGWTRGARVSRVIRGVRCSYSIFTPKALATKGLDMPATTLSRCIVIRLLPRRADEELAPFEGDNEVFRTLRRKLERWRIDNINAVAKARPPMPSGFINRLANNWHLLFAIARLASETQSAHDAAVRLSPRDKPSILARLPNMMRALFEQHGRPIVYQGVQTRYLVNTNAAELLAKTYEEFTEYRGKNPITKAQLAILLAEFQIYPRVIHLTRRASDSIRAYLERDFADLFSRFPPGSEVTIDMVKRTRKAKRKVVARRKTKAKAKRRRQ